MRERSIDMGCVWVVLALSGVGCMGDFAESGGFDGVTAGTGDGPPNAATDAETGGADTTGAGEQDESSGTGGDGESGQPPSEPGPCDGLDCGPNGDCEADGDDLPVCVCDEGYVAYGLRCLPCSSTSGSLDVDIPTATVSATFLLDGEPFPRSIYEHGDIVLRDPRSDDEVVLGSTLDGGTTHDVKVIPGSYEIHYVRRAGGLEVPANASARVEAITLTEGDAASLVIDVHAIELHGALQMNGQAPPMAFYENGQVVLRNAATGDEVVLGDTYLGEYRALVIPGTYDLHYRRKLADAEAPRNRDVRFGSLELGEHPLDQELAIDIPVTLLSGTFMLDGGDPPPGAYESGRITLRDPVTHDEIVLGSTNEGSYEQLPIVTGTYDVVYRRLLGGNEVPVNSGAVLGQVALSALGDTVDVNIETAIVNGTITVGGGPAPSDPTNDGLIILRNPDTGDEAVLGNTANGSYTRRVVRGTYDVHYRQETSSGGVPVNTNAKLDSVDIQGGAGFDVDVPMVTVSAAVTVGGAQPPSSVFDDGLLYLLDATTGDTVLLGNTRMASLQRPVVPGTYDLVYVVEAAGPTMPINAKSVLDTVDIATPTNLMVNIPVVALGGAITLDGAGPPQGFYDQASLLLHDLATEDTIDLGTIDVGAFARTLNAGRYVLAYRLLASTGMVPGNTDAGLACVDVVAP
ncbi:hypothetical protein [Paraliomyxa miuraensis]|uniref:hypothetical protein n=1 Tax=Paraliomyxa miuraensis TaxID=376150 RepID=UPI00225AF4B9|nr:hypothetical protein [Paraliomyxa miuraensis]MCX4240976.1 hypothetical protein [Paraliomyxa miuraensis]